MRSHLLTMTMISPQICWFSSWWPPVSQNSRHIRVEDVEDFPGNQTSLGETVPPEFLLLLQASPWHCGSESHREISSNRLTTKNPKEWDLGEPKSFSSWTNLSTNPFQMKNPKRHASFVSTLERRCSMHFLNKRNKSQVWSTLRRHVKTSAYGFKRLRSLLN